MFSKFEIIVSGLCVLFMAIALYVVRVETSLLSTANTTQVAQVVQPGIVFVDDSTNVNEAREAAYREALDNNGNFNRMVIDDVKVGTGKEVQSGDAVVVHYAGSLQGGQEFDNSRRNGSPFEFVVGEGMVIKGWDEGLVGMKEGGQRVLVIPSDKAYGEQGIGPIPPNATLIFVIDLLEVKS